ncbi:MAG: imidazole glycerol phosphate synthase subunit HisH [Dehalococcoidia bacterium]|nr:imidazole glycerol phosphate synthase subunit HisH [Dehalococcoidia bacterium]
MMSTVVIDYGIVNLKNILRSFEYIGVPIDSAVDPDQVLKADRIILPGVGAFASGMNELRTRGMDEAVKCIANAGRPVLGICLGMQMLLDSSIEYGQHQGLGLIPGSVVPIPINSVGIGARKIPHIGWNALRYPSHASSWKNSCLNRAPEGSFFYFVHSFMVVPEKSSHILAQCIYEGLPVTAAIKKDNITGLQFHPERSGPIGLEILHEFMDG